MTATHSPDWLALRQQILDKAVVHGRVTLSSGREADYYVDLRRVTLDATAAPLAPGGNSLRFALLVLVVLLLGLGAATAYLLPWSLLPDAIDADPERPAGLFTAWMVMTQKLGSALSVFLLGNLLSWSGYVAGLAEDQPATAVAMIRLCIGLIPAVLVTLGLVVMRRWPQQPVVSQQASA